MFVQVQHLALRVCWSSNLGTAQAGSDRGTSHVLLVVQMCQILEIQDCINFYFFQEKASEVWKCMIGIGYLYPVPQKAIGKASAKSLSFHRHTIIQDIPETWPGCLQMCSIWEQPIPERYQSGYKQEVHSSPSLPEFKVHSHTATVLDMELWELIFFIDFLNIFYLKIYYNILWSQFPSPNSPQILPNIYLLFFVSFNLILLCYSSFVLFWKVNVCSHWA